MDDQDIVHQISELAAEEHRLEAAHSGEGLGAEDHAKLKNIEVTLDRLWDLLRQRRAIRDAGGDPSAASERPAGTVEGYLQ
jgi:Protein of unknown function (DUF2630)